MEYLNIGSVFVGILLIFGFLNADAIFREPALSDPFEDDPEDDSSRQAFSASDTIDDVRQRDYGKTG